MIDRPLTGTLDSGTDAGNEQARDRAQTVQDFAVGIGIFLLAVAFVFSFVPSIITPFADAGGADTAQADRIAATIVENASAGNDANELDASVLESGGHYKADNSEDLADVLGLRKSSGHAIDNVNITVIHIEDVAKSNPTPQYESGDNYEGEVGASATRVITTDKQPWEVTPDKKACDPACQLIVRVW